MLQLFIDNLFDVIVLLLIPLTLTGVQSLSVSPIVTNSWFVVIDFVSGHFVNAIVENLFGLKKKKSD